eukprot:7388865-Prymnesium_polylepis.1
MRISLGTENDLAYCSDIARMSVANWLKNAKKGEALPSHSTKLMLSDCPSETRTCIKLGSNPVKLADPSPRADVHDLKILSSKDASLSAPRSVVRLGGSESPSRARAVEQLLERAESAERTATSQAAELRLLREQLAAASARSDSSGGGDRDGSSSGGDGSDGDLGSPAASERSHISERSRSESSQPDEPVGGDAHVASEGEGEGEGVPPSTVDVDVLLVEASHDSGNEMTFRVPRGDVFGVVVPPGVARGDSFRLQ